MRILFIVFLAFCASGLRAQDPPGRPYEVPAGGTSFTSSVELSSPYDITDIVRLKDADQGIRITNVKPNPLLSSVNFTLYVSDSVSSLGLISVEVLSRDMTVLKGTRSMRLLWSRLNNPVVRIWQSGTAPESAGIAQLVLPKPGEGITFYYVRLESSKIPKAKEFLYSDRISFSDERFHVNAANPPDGPATFGFSSTARFTLTMDPKDMPEPGKYCMEIYSAERLGVTPMEITVTSPSEPRITSIGQTEAVPGNARILINASDVDNGARIIVDGVSKPDSWVLESEGPKTFCAKGDINATSKVVGFIIKNPNGKTSNRLTLNVSASSLKMTIPQLLNDSERLFAGEEAKITIELEQAKGISTTPGKESDYRIYIGDEEIKAYKTIVESGKINLTFTYPVPDKVDEDRLELPRSIKVVHTQKNTCWYLDQDIHFRLRPVLPKKPEYASLLPGTECNFRIDGKHYNSNTLDLDIKPDGPFEIKPGSKQVINNSIIKFTLLAKDDAINYDSVAVYIKQDGRQFAAGKIKINKLPEMDFIKIKGSGLEEKNITCQDLTVGMNDNVTLLFTKSSSMEALGRQVFTVTAVVDTVDGKVLKQAFDIPFNNVQKQVSLFRTNGLLPGQNVRIIVEHKGHADSRTETTVKIRRTDILSHIGIIGGIAGVRYEVGPDNGNRNATLSDIHVGLEYNFFDDNNNFGIGAGYTILGVPKGASESATIGGAISGSIRFKALTFIVGKQFTDNPQPPVNADNKAGRGPELTEKPWYIMFGFTFGTDLNRLF